MTATLAVLEHIRSAGLDVGLTDDHRLKVTPASRITPELRELVKAHRDDLLAYLEREATNDPAPLPEPCPTQAVPEPHHQRQPSPLNSATQILGSTPPPPAPALTHAEWVTLAKAYQAHHFTCPVCIASGKGYGWRCGTGAALWANYNEVQTG